MPIPFTLSEQALAAGSMVQQRLLSTMLVSDEAIGLRRCELALPPNLGAYFPLARCRVCKRPSEGGRTCFGCVEVSHADPVVPLRGSARGVVERPKARHRR